MPLHLDDLAALDGSSQERTGQPLQLPLDDIDEDPEQPRREFDDEALRELAATIRERGVRQPVSVRPAPRRAGRWLLNFGARRLRACKLAGLQTIPAFVDHTADNYDQVIENEQREGLKPVELALFIQRCLSMGHKQADIARRLGKSRQWVTLATAMIDPPDWLLDLYRQGRCRGMMELYDLRRLHGECPQQVERWLQGRATITRDGVAALRSEIAVRAAAGTPRSTGIEASSGTLPGRINVASSAETGGLALPAMPRTVSLRVRVEMEGRDYELVTSMAPAVEGQFYIRPIEGGQKVLVAAEALKLKGFIGGESPSSGLTAAKPAST